MKLNLNVFEKKVEEAKDVEKAQVVTWVFSCNLNGSNPVEVVSPDEGELVEGQIGRDYAAICWHITRPGWDEKWQMAPSNFWVGKGKFKLSLKNFPIPLIPSQGIKRNKDERAMGIALIKFYLSNRSILTIGTTKKISDQSQLLQFFDQQISDEEDKTIGEVCRWYIEVQEGTPPSPFTKKQ